MKNYFIKIIQLALCFTAGTVIAQDVNQFNGSLNYGAPLLSVPSDRGNSIPVNLSYGGNGIYVSQGASEVGLGWNLSAGGSIFRSINGLADDFKGSIYNSSLRYFTRQRGLLTDSGATAYDILNSRRNLDSNIFYYPNYDTYSVNGPGVGGSMRPCLFNYMAFTKDVNGEYIYDTVFSGARVQPQFSFMGDFSDTLISRHYPTTPVDPSTPFHMPKDVITGDYPNDATPYFGKKGNGTGPGENYDRSTNRLGTANYVEYGMDAYGSINSFTITNSAGFVYRYDLPVYQNSTINYTYPLNNDYSMPCYTSSSYTPDVKTGPSADFYCVKHVYQAADTFITEVKESNRIPIEWKLTSITGPDYIDVGSNGVDAADKGYWVIYEYRLWAQHFYTRYPTYGFNYVSGSDDQTPNFPATYAKKRTGKLATASLNDAEVYYLNSINTSSHKAVFVRDVRNDETGANPNYDGALNDSLKINSSGTVTAWQGHMFDTGGASSSYTHSATSGTVTTTKTIQLGNINSLVLKFNALNMNKNSAGKYDNLHIYAGPNTSSPEISFTYTSTVFTSPFNLTPFTIPPVVPIGVDITLSSYTATAITFKLEEFCTATYTSNAGFDVEWHAVSNKRMPQLNVKRVLLFDNSVTGTPTFTGTINSISSSNADFDFSGTQYASFPPFNENWYQANKAAIDAVTLKGNELVYDYSLCNRYHLNINTKENRTSRLTTPAVVQASLSVNTVTVGTGKMTLNKIIPVELGGVQLLPTLKFDYNASVPNDNPSYNPSKVDYWGFYKSDMITNGHFGYTTSISKDSTDAWMLRKITSPMGGITEIEYESNTYTKVIKGNGGFRGPVRIYPIVKILATGGVVLEDTIISADLSAVYNATASAAGIVADFFVPTTLPNGGLGYVEDPTNLIQNLFGPFTYSYNPASKLPMIPIVNGKSTYATEGVPNFTSCTTFTINLSSVDETYTFYTGNGWVRFTMPVGTNTVYGAGSRVKKITNKNGASDAYVTLYEYEDGVALNEADRFINPVARYASHASCAVHEKLIPFGSDQFELSPAIGYSKTKVKNLGQVSTAKGWTESYYITSDVTPGFFITNIDNFVPNISPKSTFMNTAMSTFTSTGYPSYSLCARQDTGMIVEYVDKFSPYWGLTSEQRVYDANSNMLSRNVYEYATTDQGALVENFVFATAVATYTGPVGVYSVIGGVTTWYDPCNYFDGSNTLWQTCIKRQYPAVLQRTTSYGMGTKSITETLKRDELTGEGTVMQITGDNNTSALTIKVPAFRVSTFAAMGAKSVLSTNSNILGADAYYYSVADSSLTAPTGSVSTNFSGASANVYSQSALTRGYNSGTNTYTNTSATTNWFNKTSFGWAGAVGSIDTYGLYKKSELSSNPFNFASPYSSNSKWRFGGELSLLDDKGHTIETRGFNNKFTASKLDFKGKYLLSQISNCNYLSFTYSGFEYTGTSGTTDGELYIPISTCALTSSITAHTGSYVAAVSGGGAGPSYTVAYGGSGTYGEDVGLMLDRMYRASVWTHTSSANGARIVITLDGSVGGTPATTTYSMAVTDAKAVTIGDWKLIYADLRVPSNYTSSGGSSNNLKAYADVQGGGTAYFDDFQFHPIETQVASKVYDPATGRIVAEINSEGYATKYVYDAAGRVTATYQEIPGVGLKLIKTNSFNYARGTN